MWAGLLGALGGFISFGYLPALPLQHIVVILLVVLSSLSLSFFSPFRLRSIHFFLQIVIFCTAFVAAAGYANLKLDHYLSAKLTQPLLADAVVSIEQISDATDATGGNFRQVAVIKTLSIPNHQPMAWQRNPFIHGLTADATLPTTHLDVTKLSNIQLPAKVLLRASYRLSEADKRQLAQLQPGQIWQMRLQLNPIHAPVLAGGFDKTRWLMQLNVVAEGKIEALYQQPADSAHHSWRIWFEKKRYQLRQHISQLSQQVAYQQDQAVLLGLLTGDRSQINTETKQLYQQMGISHLLAISGPHVLFAAVVGGLLLSQVLSVFPQALRYINREKWVLSFASLLTLAYALLAGFDVPAQRTCATFVLFTVFTYLNLTVSRLQLLGLTVVVVLVYDPVAITQAGFWLSFVAVALLQHYASQQQRSVLSQHNDNAEARQPVSYPAWFITTLVSGVTVVKHLFKLQLWLFVALLPLTAWFFGQVSLVSPVSNLIAIPIISLFVVPLNLMAAMLHSFLPWVAEGLWWLALWCLHGLHLVLAALAEGLPTLVFNLHLSVAELVLAGFIGGCLLLPKGVIARFALLPLGVAWVVSVFLPTVTVAPAVLTVLDTGQGLAVLLQSKTDNWLFLAARVTDERPAKNAEDQRKIQHKQQKIVEHAKFNLSQTLLPALQAYNVSRLTGLMVLNKSQFSQQQAVYLQASLPVLHQWASGVDTHITANPCVQGQIWQNDVVQISSLSGWQAVDMPENERTCLVLIKVLHPQPQQIKTILLVPQHSQTSQQMLVALCQTQAVDMLIADGKALLTKEWLAQTQPRQAVFTSNDEITSRAGYQGYAINSNSLGLTSSYTDRVWLTENTGTAQWYLADKNNRRTRFSKQQARWYQ